MSETVHGRGRRGIIWRMGPPIRFRKQPLGIALITVLVATLLLVLLIGAFIGVSRANSSLTGNSLWRQGAYQACMSALEYARSGLEADLAWGAEDYVFTETAMPNGSNPLVVVTPDSVDPTLLRGYLDSDANLSSSDARSKAHLKFTLRVSNNLAGLAPLPGPPAVPSKAVRLEITGSCGRITRKMQALLRRRPYSHDAILANHDIRMADDTENWEILSRDAHLNRIRSNGNIIGPHWDKIRFSGKVGLAMATSDVRLNGQSLTSNPELVEEVEAATRGRFQTRAPEIIVPDLEQGDLEMPETELQVPGGSYTFGQAEGLSWEPVTFFLDTDGNPDNGAEDGPYVRYRQNKTFYSTLRTPGGTYVSLTSTGERSTPFGSPDSPTWGYDSPGPTGLQGGPYAEQNDSPVLAQNPLGQKKFQVNLLSERFVLSSGVKVTPQPGPCQDLIIPEGKILFGYDYDPAEGYIFQALSDGLSAALRDPGQYMSAFVADGDVVIGGGSGYGSIYAEGNVVLSASSGLRATPDLAVSLRGRGIQLNPVDPPAPSDEGTSLGPDFPAFGTAMEGYGNWSVLNNWMALDATQAGPFTDDLLQCSIGSDADEIWSELTGGDPLPDSVPSSIASGDLSLQEYVQLREFWRSGNGEWFTDTMAGQVKSAATNQITTWAYWADVYQTTLNDYMSGPEPVSPDMYFVGLVWAGDRGFSADANGNSLLIEGALVSQGSVVVKKTSRFQTVYNRLYLDDVLKDKPGLMRMEQLFVNIQ
ncbi:MAG: hypothetical protein HY319_04165 [Armatimonadetes bacterium]|nr:hypothetical protein [Armatimonadota bacterium]